MAVGGSSGGDSKGIKAGRAYVEVGVDNSGLKGGLESAKRMLLNFGKGLAVGGGALLGIGASITGPILESFREVVKAFSELHDASDRTGVGTEALSDLAYAAKLSDASLADVVKGFKGLNNVMADAEGGSASAQAALGKLGLTFKDLKGKEGGEQFALLSEGLERLDDAAQGPALENIFGGRAAQKLLPMLKNSNELRKMLEENARVGGRVSAEDAANADKIGDSFDRVKEVIKNTFRAIGAALLPHAEEIEKFSYAFADAAKQIQMFVKENRDVVLSVLGIGAAITAVGGILVGLGSAFAVASFAVGGFATAFGVVASVIGAILSPVGLLVATVGVLGVVLLAAAAETETFWEVLAQGQAIFAGLAEVFGLTWKGIKQAMAAGDLKLAFEIAVAGLEVVWEGFVFALTSAWTEGMLDVSNRLHAMLTEIKVAMTDAIRWANKLLPEKLRKEPRSEASIREEAEADKRIREFDARRATPTAGALANAMARLRELEIQSRPAPVEAGPMPRELARQRAVEGLSGTVRGQFGGQYGSRGLEGLAFAGGDSIAKQQLDEQKKGNGLLDGIKRKIGGLEVN